MPYNESSKKATYKYMAKNSTKWHEYALENYHTYREHNLETIQAKDRLRKRPLEIEWRIFRKINVFN